MSTTLSGLFNPPIANTNPPPVIQGDLIITCNGVSIGTWSEIRLTRSLRRFSDFEVSLTEKNPFNYSIISLKAFDVITVSITNGTPVPNLVLTGYVLDYDATIGDGYHTVTIRGRSKCGATIELSSCGIGTAKNDVNLLQLATELCQPFGIIPYQPSGETAPISYPVLSLNATQTDKEIIQQVAAYSNMIIYDDVYGNLVLSTVGAGTMASALMEGQNVQSGNVRFSGERRVHKYIVVQNAASQVLNSLPGGNDGPLGQVTDDGVPIPTMKVFQASGFGGSNANLPQRQAQWQASHNWGEGQEITLIVDSWRDSKGKLWEPNWFCQVLCPTLKVVNVSEFWVIADVTYKMDMEGGKTSELRLSPKEAFLPEPVPIISGPQSALPNATGNTPVASPTAIPSTAASGSNPNLFTTGSGLPAGAPT